EPRPARGPAAAVVVGTLPAPDVVVAGGRAAPAGIVRTRRRPPRTAHAVTRWARGTAGLGHHRFSRRRPAGAAPATQPDARRRRMVPGPVRARCGALDQQNRHRALLRWPSRTGVARGGDGVRRIRRAALR